MFNENEYNDESSGMLGYEWVCVLVLYLTNRVDSFTRNKE